MVGDPDFVTSIGELLKSSPVACTGEDTVTPGRRAFLLAGIISIRAYIVFVRGRESNWHLMESPQSEPRPAAFGREELVPVEELLEVAGTNRVDDGVPAHGVDSVVEITTQNTDFVVQDHRSIPACNVAVKSFLFHSLDGQDLAVEDGRDVCIALFRLILASCKMTIDEAK